MKRNKWTRSIVQLAVIIHYLNCPFPRQSATDVANHPAMTISSEQPTGSSLSMTSTVELVKCTLFALVFLVVCLLCIVVETDFYPTVQTPLALEIDNLPAREAENSLSNAARNISEIMFSFGIGEETFVRFNELKRGTPLGPEEIRRTILRVDKTCETYNETETLRRKHFLHSPENRALYCWIRKVASTSFTKFFGELRGRKVSRDYYKQVDFLAPNNLNELRRIIRDRSVFKFLVVRHPFERLVSSYRDRIEDNSRYTAQAWIYTPRIFRLTRPELFYRNATGNVRHKIFDKYQRLKLTPTFAEFVAWLLKQHSANDDDHWNQYHKHCSLCTANFDYILKLDNYTLADVEYVFSKLGLNVTHTGLPKLQSTRGGASDFPRTCGYFASLSRDSALRLWERYKIDFEMFDYEYANYVDCAATGRGTGSSRLADSNAASRHSK